MLNNSFGRRVLLALCVCRVGLAQSVDTASASTPPTPPTATTTASELDAPGTIELAGFSFAALGDGFNLRCDEVSTGVLYSVDVFRSSSEGPHRVSDDAPFIRFSQTVLPLTEVGTLDQLQAAVLADAQTAARDIEGNSELGNTTECTREILGKPRTGKRFAANLSHVAEQGSHSILGHIEVYAFEHEGKGVAVTLRAAESDKDAKADDAAHAEALLDRLVLKPVTRSTPYTYTLAGIPVRLPVASRVASVEQPDDMSINALVNLESGNLSLYIAKVPEEYDLNATFNDVSGEYTALMDSQVEQSGGQVSVEWASQTAIPGPEGSPSPTFAPAMLLNIPDGQIYSLFYKDLIGRVIVTGTFNLDASKPAYAHTVTTIFADGFNGGGDRQMFKSYDFPAHSITLPRDYWLTALHDDEGRIDLIVIRLIGSGTPEKVLQNVRSHRSYTVLQTLRPNDARNLNTLNKQLVERLKYLDHDAPKPGDPPRPDLGPATEAPLSTADGEPVTYLSRAALPAPAPGAEADSKTNTDDPIIVHSRLLETVPGGPRVHIASVSNPFMADDSLAITEHLASLLKPLEHPGTLPLNFGVLHYDPWVMYPTSYRSDFEQQEVTWFMLDGDRVEITTSDRDERLEVLSSRLLADRFVKLKWRSLALSEEQGQYPEDSKELTEATIAGHPAVMFQAHLPGQDETPGAIRAKSVRVRLYGLVHDNRYTTIAITQYENFDDARFDRIEAMFKPEE